MSLWKDHQNEKGSSVNSTRYSFGLSSLLASWYGSCRCQRTDNSTSVEVAEHEPLTSTETLNQQGEQVQIFKKSQMLRALLSKPFMVNLQVGLSMW